MRIGTVLGEIRLHSWAQGFEEIRCKQVRLEDGVTVAADLVDARPGELVLLTEGPAANGYRADLRCDALILGILEKEK